MNAEQGEDDRAGGADNMGNMGSMGNMGNMGDMGEQGAQEGGQLRMEGGDEREENEVDPVPIIAHHPWEKGLLQVKIENVGALAEWHKAMLLFFAQQRAPYDYQVDQAGTIAASGKVIMEDVQQFLTGKLAAVTEYGKMLLKLKLLDVHVKNLPKTVSDQQSAPPHSQDLPLTAALRRVGVIQVEAVAKLQTCCDALEEHITKLKKFQAEWASQCKTICGQLYNLRKTVDTALELSSKKLSDHQNVMTDMRHAKKGAPKDLWLTEQTYRESVGALKTAHSKYVAAAQKLSAELNKLEQQRIANVQACLTEFLQGEQTMWTHVNALAVPVLVALGNIEPAAEVQAQHQRMKSAASEHKEGNGHPAHAGHKEGGAAENVVKSPGMLPPCQLFAMTGFVERKTNLLRRWQLDFLVFTRDHFLYCFEADKMQEQAAKGEAKWNVSIEHALWSIDFRHAKCVVENEKTFTVDVKPPGIMSRNWKAEFRVPKPGKYPHMGFKETGNDKWIAALSSKPEED